MQRLNELHKTIAGGTVLAGFGGLAFGNDPITFNVVLLTVLLLALRAKFWVDDEAYFVDVESGKLSSGWPFYVGLLFAFGSWIVWLFASLFIKDLERAAVLMVWVFSLSTGWIVATMIQKGAYLEQVPWLFLNAFYALGFYLISARTREWNPYRSSTTGFTTIVLLSLIFLFVADLGVTRILEARRRGPSASLQT